MKNKKKKQNNFAGTILKKGKGIIRESAGVNKIIAGFYERIKFEGIRGETKERKIWSLSK